MLERFRKAQEKEIARLKEWEKAGTLPSPYAGKRPPFAARLRDLGPGAIIAEYKRASPSLGDINLAPGPEEIAQTYAEAGAGALSVLTERVHFKGELPFLERMSGPGLPLLRKDFLLHPLQISESAATPASAVLLIVRMLEGHLLRVMLQTAHMTKLEVVLEVFDKHDLLRAQDVIRETDIGPVIIQVNNRDLDTLVVSDTASRQLIDRKKEGEFWISASGITSREQVLKLASLGFDAMLVGSSLMMGNDPGGRLALLAGRAGGTTA